MYILDLRRIPYPYPNESGNLVLQHSIPINTLSFPFRWVMELNAELYHSKEMKTLKSLFPRLENEPKTIALTVKRCPTAHNGLK